MPEVNVTKFESGAVRSTGDEIPYCLLPWEGWRRAGLAAIEGEEKYGAHNFRLGITQKNLLNHAIEHIQRYAMGEIGEGFEDHLGHAIWNLAVCCENEKIRPHLLAGLLGPGGTLTPAILEDLARLQAEREARKLVAGAA